ncbi:hypothetical protein V5O48_010739 [Marasmius crinis-equi]|uniref:Uncharacterized protein n=1 Tax=Marasmius crinis-equi TaxID=585013 RepID=A0ABR3F7K2_9AGAR
MDPQRGTLCRGPPGPEVVGWYCVGFHADNIVPSSADLLQEDVCFRFLTGLKSKEVDRAFVEALNQPRRPDSTDLRFNQPTVISTLTNTSIASTTNRWRYGDGMVGVLLGNGQTRFALNDLPTNISLQSDASVWFSNQSASWLSQAWSVFHAHGVSLEDDLSQYELTVPHINLDLPLSQSPSKSRRRRYWPRPIFLFIRPLPSTLLQSCSTSSLHYWSSDEDGQPPLSANMCNYLGLPVTLDLKVYSSSAYSWSNDIYKTMRRYQFARGFDPRTTDFARSLGHPAYKPIQNADSDRFEEIGGTKSVYFRPSSPPTLYRSQAPDESDIDTDLGYSDTDTDSDFFESHARSIWNPYDDAHGFDDYWDFYNKPFNSYSPDVDDLCTRFTDLALV